MLSTTIHALFAKEMRQLRRSRVAMITSTLLPLFLMVVSPLGQYLSMRQSPDALAGSTGGLVPAGTAALESPEAMMSLFFMPFTVVIGGLIVPVMAATYTVVAERERRTVELLVALPARIRDILAAKLLAMLVMSGIVLGPLMAIDALWLSYFDIASPGQLLVLVALLASAIACSTTLALLVALVARDFRTANQMTGALIGPLILLTIGTFLLLPPHLAPLASIGVLLGVSALSLVAALRWLTFERYTG